MDTGFSRLVVLKVRVVSVDFRMVVPDASSDATHLPSTSAGTAAEIEHVPVIRVFGATPMGQNVCLYVHQVFPYFFVPYVGPTDPDQCYRYRERLHASLNQALDMALRNSGGPPSSSSAAGAGASKTTDGQKQNLPSGLDNPLDRKLQHVLQVELVRGNPIYGYTHSDRLFLKIYMVNPSRLKRAATLLQNGAVMNTPLQPHESHIPYLLQFFIDYNIYGMDYIELSHAIFKRPLPPDIATTAVIAPGDVFNALSSPLSSHKLPRSLLGMGKENVTHYNIHTVPQSAVWPADHVLASRESYCELEADTVASAILNRSKVRIGDRPAHGPPIGETKPTEEKLVRSLSDIWEDEKKRRVKQRRSDVFTAELSQDRKEATGVFGSRYDHVYQELLQGDRAEGATSFTPPVSSPQTPLRPSASTAQTHHPSALQQAMTVEDLMAWEAEENDFESEYISDDLATVRAWQRLKAAQHQHNKEPTQASSAPKETVITEGQAAAQPVKSAPAVSASSFASVRLAQEPLWSPQLQSLSQTPSSKTGGQSSWISAWPQVKHTPLRFSSSPSVSKSASSQMRLGNDVDVGIVLATQGRSLDGEDSDEERAMEREVEKMLAELYEDRIHNTPLAQSTPLVRPPTQASSASNSRVRLPSQMSDESSSLAASSASNLVRLPSQFSDESVSLSATSTPDQLQEVSPSDPFELSDSILRGIRSSGPSSTPSRKHPLPSVESTETDADQDVDSDDHDLAELAEELEQANALAEELDQDLDEFLYEGTQASARATFISPTPRSSQRGGGGGGRVSNPLEHSFLRPLSVRLDQTESFQESPSSLSQVYPSLVDSSTQPRRKKSRIVLLPSQFDGAGDDEPHTILPSQEVLESDGDGDGDDNDDDGQGNRQHFPRRVLKYKQAPPRAGDVRVSAGERHIAQFTLYQEPYFSRSSDIPSRPRVFADREYVFRPQSIALLPSFHTVAGGTPVTNGGMDLPRHDRVLRYLKQPPLGRLLVKSAPRLRHDQGDDRAMEMALDQVKDSSIAGGEDAAPSSPTGPSFAINLPMVTSTPARPITSVAASVTSPPPPPPPKTPFVPPPLAAAAGRLASQLEGPTPRNPFGFKVTPVSSSAAEQATDMLFQKQHLRVLSLEVMARTRGHLLSDPKQDDVIAVFFCLHDDRLAVHSPHLASHAAYQAGFYPGAIVVDPSLSDSVPAAQFTGTSGYQLQHVASEPALFDALVELVHKMDPDVLVGYEIQRTSWGYLVDRAPVLGRETFATDLSRVHAPFAGGNDGFESDDGYNYRQNAGLAVTGRIVLNLWRILRSDLPLNIYTFENVVFHVLHQRIPYVPPEHVIAWWTQGRSVRWRAIEYFMDRVQKNLQLVEELDIVGRTSEFARVFGIDFASVISRGSQYRVESMMLRLAKQENFIAVSPSKRQVENQRAPESIPLVMEPQSRFYSSPVVVLDFQSLYPSIMIAYNYCFSTCLGRVAATIGPQGKKLGASTLAVPPGLLSSLKEHIRVSPNGVMFVTTHVRKGVLPRMLTEILDTRVMVKKSLKHNKANKVLARMLDARQLGLKLIANVTYGYTSASFSGRMPCAEVADAIVQTARETLERSIRVIEDEFKGSKVVYGDTDSLFVHLPGATREEAFKIGHAISERITALNPKPMKLKFEKVYHPCMLLTKKRYVGFMYEKPEDKEPVFDAKGIETVRRDTCPAVSKTLERTIKMLFRTQDLSEIKVYLQRQWSKILTGRVSLQDFIFAKEVRLGTYSTNSKSTMPPSALVATHRMSTDHRAQPRFGERVRYVVVYGGPQARLMDLVVPPEQLVNDKSLRLHGTYYITKQIIPAVGRVLHLVGADLMAWFSELPRVYRAGYLRGPGLSLIAPPSPNNSTKEDGPKPGGNVRGVRTIDAFYQPTHCFLCHAIAPQEDILCTDCKTNPQQTVLTGMTVLREAERAYAQIVQICHNCIGGGVMEDPVACVSLDCNIYFERIKALQALERLDPLRQALYLFAQ